MTTLHEQWQKFEALDKARTPGEWYAKKTSPNIQIHSVRDVHIASTATKANRPYGQKEADAELIASVPAMLDHIRQCHAEMERMRQALHSARPYVRAWLHQRQESGSELATCVAEHLTKIDGALNPKPEERVHETGETCTDSENVYKTEDL